jgi:predicted 3-demethylubiquinone-9 3-methyltransferase (glyoxalase superfamily)
MSAVLKVKPCLWFDTQAEEAAKFYVSLFKNSQVVSVSRYPEDAPRPAGMAMTVEFELDGQEITALNGGPEFTFTEAISLQIDCESQEEADHFWEALGEGGEHGPCGWLKDRYGLSWQIVPAEVTQLVTDPDPERAKRAMTAMLQMSRLDVAEVRRAADDA